MSKQFLRKISCLVILSFILFPLNSYPLPEGEQVVAGQATFDRSQENTLNITQTTGSLIANYNSFSIGEPETVNFFQPSTASMALNRVTGVNPSQILGKLTATGKIYLINPNGILFGPNSIVDASGMIASTLNITNQDFLAGRLTFIGNGGSVVNQGYIASPGGYVALLGNTVKNNGIIEAELGSIALASGSAVTLTLDPQGIMSVVVDDATTQNLKNSKAAVENTGTISAGAGRVVLTAKALKGVFKNAVNTSGIIEADAIGTETGEIVLEANDRVAVAGTVSAKGGTLTVDSEGADISADITAQEAEFNMNDGDTNINGASYTGDNSGTYTAPGTLTLSDNGNIDMTGTLAVSGGELTLIADNDKKDGGNLSVHGATVTLDGGDIWLEGSNVTVSSSTIQSVYDPLTSSELTDPSDVDINIFAHNSTVEEGSDTTAIAVSSSSDILAQVVGEGSAYINMIAGDHSEAEEGDFEESHLLKGGPVTVTGSTVHAKTQSGFDSAEVSIMGSDTLIDSSDITAEVTDAGSALINIIAGEYDYSSNGNNESLHFYNGGDNRIVNGSNVRAEIGSGFNNGAEVTVAGQDIAIDKSTVTAHSVGAGEAGVELIAGRWDKKDETGTISQAGTINVTGESTITSQIGSGEDTAEVRATAGILNIASSTVQAIADTFGTARVSLDADGLPAEITRLTVDNSTVKATVTDEGTAEVLLDAGHKEKNSGTGYDEFWHFGGTVDIKNNSVVLAQIGSGFDSAKVGVSAKDIFIDASSITAKSIHDGTARVELSAAGEYYHRNQYWSYENARALGGGIDLTGESSVLADVGGKGNAEVEMTAGGAQEEQIDGPTDIDTINIIKSSVTATVANGGEEKTESKAHISIRDGNWYEDWGGTGCEYSDSFYWSESLWAGTVNILQESTVLASVGDGKGNTDIDILAGGSADINPNTINIDNSSVTSITAGEGESQIFIRDGNYYAFSSDDYSDNSYSFNESLMAGTVNITGKSTLLAQSGSGEAGIEILGGGAGLEYRPGTVTIDESSVTSRVIEKGYASVRIRDGNYSENEWWNNDEDKDAGARTKTELLSSGTVNIFSSGITAATASGDAAIDIESGGPEAPMIPFTINIGASTLLAQVAGAGSAHIFVQDGSFNSYSGTRPPPTGTLILLQQEDNDSWYEQYCEEGGTVNITAGSSLNAEVLGSTGAEDESEAVIEVYGGAITVAESAVSAAVTGTGDTTVSLGASETYFRSSTEEDERVLDYPHVFSDCGTECALGGSITVQNSTLSANTTGSAGHENARVTLQAKDILIQGGSLLAQLSGYGNATVEVYAADMRRASSEVSTCEDENCQIEGPWDETGDTSLWGGTLQINGASTLSAAVTRPQGIEGDNETRALIDLFGGTITVNNSMISSQFTGQGYAETSLLAGDYYHETVSDRGENGQEDVYENSYNAYGGTIDIVNTSSVTATATEDTAEVDLEIGQEGEMYPPEDCPACGGYILTDVSLKPEPVSVGPGHITVSGSNVIADVNGQGHAGVYLYTSYEEPYWPQELVDLVSEIGSFDEDIEGPVDGYVTIDNGSRLHAEAGNTAMTGTAVVALTSIDDLTVDASEITAQDNEDIALVALYTEAKLRILGESLVGAQANNYLATVLALALADDADTGIEVAPEAVISADGGKGFGLIGLLTPAGLDAAGTITATGTLDVISLAEELAAGLLTSIFDAPLTTIADIAALYPYGSAVLLGSLCGNIRLGDIGADAVIAATLGGSIYDAGDVNAHLLSLLAWGDIGTAASAEAEENLFTPGPINTNVDVLTAYSWGEGDIHINEENSIELGFYRPVLMGDTESTDAPVPVLEVAASVAANNGIISIVSGGDMLINSVIAPRGGVFLQSAAGSLYAGYGWCPVVSQCMVEGLGYAVSGIAGELFNFEIDPEYASFMIGEFLMGQQETPWGFYLGVDYFSPVMVGLPECGYPLAQGPNIIAGGYSYLSAPQGTIGVGTPLEKDPTMSGAITGIVRPAVGAVTGEFPAPGIDLSRFTPPGIILYNDTDGCEDHQEPDYTQEPLMQPLVMDTSDECEQGCCSPFAYFEQGARNEGPVQIWPETLAGGEPSFDNPLAVCIQVTDASTRALPSWFLDSLGSQEPYEPPTSSLMLSREFIEEIPEIAALTLEIGSKTPPPPDDIEKLTANNFIKELKIYYEAAAPIRVTSGDPAGVMTFYAYHPLTPTDNSAFDEIELDTGAYEFIGENLKLRKKLNPFYGTEEGNKEAL